MHNFSLIAALAAMNFAVGYAINELHHPRHSGIQATAQIESRAQPDLSTGGSIQDVQYVLDGNKYVGSSCY